MIQAKALILIAMCIAGAMADCSKPQAIYRVANTSLFFGIQDIQEALVESFQNNLKDIKYDVSKKLPNIPKEEVYTLKDIVPNVVYKSEDEKELLGTNTLTKTGGVLQISVTMSFDFVDGKNVGKGTATGQFVEVFPVTLVKTSSFSADKGLQWSCVFTSLALPDMVFLKNTGTELDSKHQTVFTELLNQSLGSSYVSVKAQLQNELSGVQPKINNINNMQVGVLFSNKYEYSFSGKRMEIDETLKGYALSSTGETMNILGVPTTSSISCNNITPLDTTGTYYAVSTSIMDNSFNYLRSNKLLQTSLDAQTWHINNFHFTVRDLAFILPTISSYYSLNNQISGDCLCTSGTSPVYNKATNAFDAVLNYSCELNMDIDKTLIMNFMTSAQLQLTPKFSDIQTVVLQVTSSTFESSQFVPNAQYGQVYRIDLAQYYISQAAESLLNSNVFGSSLIMLPSETQTPAWKMGADGTTMFFYDASVSVQTE